AGPSALSGWAEKRSAGKVTASLVQGFAANRSSSGESMLDSV
ncbi:MAG: hypothetical protein ACI8Z5_002040, partial [Lentimonas sp.]